MTSTPTQRTPAEIRDVIGRLRSRIRGYVWAEGIAAALIWLGLTFWVGLALDYLPVLVGSTEMPRIARLTLLVIVSFVLLYIIYRRIIRRAFARLADKSLALLIERQFPEFQDSLVTTIEFSEKADRDSAVDPAMLSRTSQVALDRVSDVELKRILNFGPLIRSLFGAGAMVLSLVLFALLSNEAFATWTSRFYLLSDDPWPRRAQIELIGFEDGVRKVAEGGDLTINVRADAGRDTPPPDVCTIHYWLDSGERGRVNMNKEGEPRDGYQYYSFSSTPFKGMLDSIEFDIVGFDHRISGFRVEVVDSPVITDVQLRCELPEYTGLLPRTEEWSIGTRLPMGSEITVVATANKPLVRVQLTDVSQDSEKVEVLKPMGSDSRKFTYAIRSLDSRVAKNIELYDQDGISSQQPFRLTIGAIEDQPPEVSVMLDGIGDAITPDARIAVQGKAEDDYSVAATWFHLLVAESEDRPSDSFRFPIELPSDGTVNTALDLRELRTRDDKPMEVEIGERVRLTVQAQDKYNLSDEPQIGTSEEYDLRVVEPSELLALLEARELGLRRRFEQIISEMTQTRDMIARVQTESRNRSTTDSSEPDTTEPEVSELETAIDQTRSLKGLRVQRARQQGDKSTQEILGVAASFETIRDELVNNRVDTEERKIRIEQQIVEPLKDIVDLQFPDWDDSLKELVSLIENNESTEDAAAESVRLTDEILLAMERVLQKMEELESYNELVDLVRSIIKDQEQLLEKTRLERKNQAKSLLE